MRAGQIASLVLLRAGSQRDIAESCPSKTMRMTSVNDQDNSRHSHSCSGSALNRHAACLAEFVLVPFVAQAGCSSRAAQSAGCCSYSPCIVAATLSRQRIPARQYCKKDVQQTLTEHHLRRCHKCSCHSALCLGNWCGCNSRTGEQPILLFVPRVTCCSRHLGQGKHTQSCQGMPADSGVTLVLFAKSTTVATSLPLHRQHLFVGDASCLEREAAFPKHLQGRSPMSRASRSHTTWLQSASRSCLQSETFLGKDVLRARPDMLTPLLSSQSSTLPTVPVSGKRRCRRAPSGNLKASSSTPAGEATRWAPAEACTVKPQQERAGGISWPG